jgi:hypothetical protein
MSSNQEVLRDLDELKACKKAQKEAFKTQWRQELQSIIKSKKVLVGIIVKMK